jgi:hypothetical protein
MLSSCCTVVRVFVSECILLAVNSFITTSIHRGISDDLRRTDTAKSTHCYCVQYIFFSLPLAFILRKIKCICPTVVCVWKCVCAVTNTYRFSDLQHTVNALMFIFCTIRMLRHVRQWNGAWPCVMPSMGGRPSVSCGLLRWSPAATNSFAYV